MLKKINCKIIHEIDINNFHDKLAELQTIINLVNEKNKDVDINEIHKGLNETIKFTTKLVNDPIKHEIAKLIVILEKKGIDTDFYTQLDYLSEFVKSETLVEEYEPINDKFIEVYNNQEKEKGVSLLCKDLDESTGGLHRGKICTIVGGPGSMKTTYATNICYQAIKDGNNVCFLSLEETSMDIYSKLLSRASLDIHKGIAVQNIIQHKLAGDEEKILLEEVYPHLESLKGTFYLLSESDLGDLSQVTIERQLKSVDEKIKLKSAEKQNGENHGIDIIVVDHLQMFKYANSKINDEYQLMNSYVSLFRKNSKNFLNQDREVIIIILSQCNREGICYATKHDGQYLISHVAEASEIERASSYIISVYTDAITQVSKLLKIGAIKLRGASLPFGTINISTDAQFYKVGDAEENKELNYSSEDIQYNCVNIKESNNTIDSLESLLGSITLY